MRRAHHPPTLPDFDIDVLIFGVKRCRSCGVERAANSEQFHRDRSEPDGLTNRCAACRRAHSVTRDKAERNRRQRERYATDPEYRECIKARSRADGRKAREGARAAQGGDRA